MYSFRSSLISCRFFSSYESRCMSLVFDVVIVLVSLFCACYLRLLCDAVLVGVDEVCAMKFAQKVIAHET